MTKQELWEGLQAVERCETMDEARVLVRDLLGRMERPGLAVVASALARTFTPEDFADMDPEDREMWRRWRISAALRDRQGRTAERPEGGVQ